MHRQIMQPPKGMVVDHLNRNRLNDCRSNLRVCTPGENVHNCTKRVGTVSRFRGVRRYPQRRRWHASVTFEGEYAWLGSFDEEIEAARAYDYGAVERWGRFASVSLPEEWPPERRRKIHAAWRRKMAREKAKKVKAKSKRTAVQAKAPAHRRPKHSTRGSKRTTKQASRG